MELRLENAELRTEDDGTMTVEGYVNETNSFSGILGKAKKFKEKIAPGAFSRAIQESTRDIDFLAEHNKRMILSSTRNQSLTLSEDDVGLFMSAEITPTSWGKDYYELIKSKILSHMSFGFATKKESWVVGSSGLYERTIEELDLFEVSVVRNPAYSESSIQARDIEITKDVEVPENIVKEKRENMAESTEEVLADMNHKLTAVLENQITMIDHIAKLEKVYDSASTEDEQPTKKERSVEGEGEGEPAGTDETPADDTKTEEDKAQAVKEAEEAKEAEAKKKEEEEAAAAKLKEEKEKEESQRSIEPHPTVLEAREKIKALTGGQ